MSKIIEEECLLTPLIKGRLSAMISIAWKDKLQRNSSKCIFCAVVV